MAHLTKNQLGQILKSRKILNQAINQALGTDLNLYDISQSSQKSSISNNSVSRKNNDQLFSFNSNLNLQTNSNLNTNATNNLNGRKSQKFDDFFTIVSNQNRVQKLYKQNIELQKKMMSIKDQNQNYKVKALLWQKTKQFILDNMHKQFKLKSIRFSSTDAAIFQQFVNILSQILNKYHSHNNFKVNFENEEKENHKGCKQVYQDLKKKLQQQSKKVSKLYLQIDLLTGENKILKQRQNTFQKQRKARMSQIQQNIYQKFGNIQKSLHQKTQQNILLQKKVINLQSQLMQTKSSLSPLKQKDKTLATQPQSVKDFSQIQLNRKISKIKDQQINILKKQSKLLSDQVQNLKASNQKMKKVIKLAQNLNNDFLSKLQQSAKRNQPHNQYGLSQQNKEKLQKSELHLSGQKFKIVKSRSVQKNKFSYNEKKRNY